MELPADEDSPREQVRTFLARALTEIDGRPVTMVVSVPAAAAPLSIFLQAVPRHMSFLWNPPVGTPFAGSESAWLVRLEGQRRLEQLRHHARELFARLQTRAMPGIEPAPPRLIGGLAFEPMAGPSAPWEEFSDGCFSLARWAYERHDDVDGDEGGVLSVALNGDQDRGYARHAEILGQVDSILDALAEYEGQRTKFAALLVPRILEEAVTQLPFEDWFEHIGKIKAAIGSGAYGKIVAARRCVVDLPRKLDETDVLSRLAAEPGCTRFAFRGDHSSFIGASPETLFTKTGDEVATQALAGTIRSLGSELPVLSQRSFQLLASEKDLAEHAFVVRQIVASLEPLTTSITLPDTPKIHKVRNILHLNTPIRARLKSDVMAADLIAALHPTPAVGGTPKREAAQWIAANEPQPRGWYTGALGWIDANGDAAFIVAIRCGLLTANRAYIYTGAGIVGESDAASEYAETELKQLPLLRALGVVL